MRKHPISLILVIIAGEAIFMLPFMIPRLYRPLILEAWHLTNRSFGAAFAAYGITASLSYLFGGPFADKFHPRVLISVSLASTALGSVYMAMFPSDFSLTVTYGFFGVSTILLMWGALIKTTHIAGGEEQRSSAMGLLDAGRGLTAAACSSVLVLLVTLTVPDLASQEHQSAALNIIYLSTAAFTFLIAISIWFSLKDFQPSDEIPSAWELRKALKCLRYSKVWLLSAVVLGSYCGYKGVDNYSTYLVDVQGVDLSRSSMFTSLVFWLRPVSAFATGILADRFHNKNGSSRFLILVTLLFLGAVFQLLLALRESTNFSYAFSVILFSAAFAYALRAIYFSVFGDLRIPHELVGTTTGIVSFVGFMPDIFFSYITGHLIDAHPGALGFQHAFVFTAACLFIGAGASFLLFRQSRSLREAI